MQLDELFCLLQQECNAKTCSEMKASEWVYLCAAHSEPSSCSAIDYILHTLESSSTLLNSDSIGPKALNLTPAQDKMCQNLSRRLYRIFAHAYFQHPELFALFEGQTSLYERFVQICLKYELLTTKMIIIPLSVNKK